MARNARHAGGARRPAFAGGLRLAAGAALAVLLGAAAAVPLSQRVDRPHGWQNGAGPAAGPGPRRHVQLRGARDPGAPAGGWRRHSGVDDRQPDEMEQGEPRAGAAFMTVANPARLGGARAEQVYQAIRVALRERYTNAGDPVTQAYQRWRRYTAAPFRSALHGNRFINIYANDQARRYGRFETPGRMPEGAMVAADSFAVTSDGKVMTGPFFLMEKRERGFDPATRDWLYMMVGADGELVGLTNGKGSEHVRFCAACHNAAPPEQDSLWLPPKPWRRR